MAFVLYRLGPLVFSIRGAAPETVENSTNYRWPTQNRLGRRPALQWVGIGEQNITFSGTIYPTFDPLGDGSIVGIRRIDEIRQLADQGLPLDLHDGLGHYYGRWCIRSIKETRSVLFNNSAPRKQDFTIELGRYGEDGDTFEQSILYEGGSINTPRIDGATNPELARLA
jgi:phage protein U